jgi:hypothetical protein
VTQDAALGLSVTLYGGTANVEYVGIDMPLEKGLTIEAVIPNDDMIVLKNNGTALDLTGWYLYSDRGNEWFSFPDGYVIGAGQTLTIGSNTSNGACDLIWNDKRIIHQKKTDNIALYDHCGRVVDSRSNSL